MAVTAPAPPTTRRVSVVIPCLDEAETIAECVRRSRAVLDASGLVGEVIVVDNGSTDGSGDLARAAGAVVVEEPRRGYGSAYLAGLDMAAGDYIVMLDADLTYDFDEIPRFVEELDHGAQLVVGNRMQSIRPGAMPLLSRLGNPLLSGFLNVLHRTNVQDVHCGMRALRRDVLPVLNLRTVGMEFASEMVIRATRERLDVREVPIFGRNLYIHSLIVGCLLILVGVQAVGTGLAARVFGVYFISDQDQLFQRLRARLKLEHGLALALVCGAAGLALLGLVIERWASHGFGTLREERLAILATTIVAASAQIFFTSFLLSILGLRRRRDDL